MTELTYAWTADREALYIDGDLAAEADPGSLWPKRALHLIDEHDIDTVNRIDVFGPVRYYPDTIDELEDDGDLTVEHSDSV